MSAAGWSEGAAGPVLRASERADVNLASLLREGGSVRAVALRTGLTRGEVIRRGRALGFEYDIFSHTMHRAAPAPALLGALALPDAEDLSWQDRALCAQTDPEAFFPEKGGSTREAKKVCRSCEVRAECLEYALEHDERFGIWGGLSENERRKLRRAA